MPRRAGKAASRRARQRPPRRPNIPATPISAAPPAAADESAAEAEPRPESPAPATRRVAGPQFFQPAGSSLSQRERAEYHYVERDLRNIGILTAVLAVLLLVAWFAFQALGLVG
jgi:hypothetical protein